MKILIIADVHNRPGGSVKTLLKIENVIKKVNADLIVFLGDIVHGPDFTENDKYERYLRQVLDLTGSVPFATVFGNHDDECHITKDEILSVMYSYPNCLTKGCNYVVKMKGEQLLFMDSGSYYQGEGSYYDTVNLSDTLNAVKAVKDGEKAILFQHIIMPDIIDMCEESRIYKPGCVWGKNGWIRFKKGVKHTGVMLERPCPPDINTSQLSCLAPYIKAAVFGHDHLNDFELYIQGVKFIQCPGSGSNSYDWYRPSSVKILDTKTLKTQQIFL